MKVERYILSHSLTFEPDLNLVLAVAKCKTDKNNSQALKYLYDINTGFLSPTTQLVFNNLLVNFKSEYIFLVTTLALVSYTKAFC